MAKLILKSRVSRRYGALYKQAGAEKCIKNEGDDHRRDGTTNQNAGYLDMH